MTKKTYFPKICFDYTVNAQNVQGKKRRLFT